MSHLHFIRLSDDKNLDQIKEKYDYLASNHNLLERYILEHLENNKSNKIIAIGGNKISNEVINAINKTYDPSSDNLLVLYINNILTDTILDSAICYGIDSKSDIDMINNHNLLVFTDKKIIDNNNGIINIIKNKVKEKNVHVCLDMTIFNKLDSKYIKKLLFEIKKSIVSINIYNVTNNCNHHTDCREILKGTFDIKEKSINIFTEDSQFIVFRPLDQDGDEGDEEYKNDIGWYILRGMDIETKNEILAGLSDDNIITIDIDGESYFITKTTINEQNQISYYTANTIQDVALFPQEKQLMMFELVNL